MYKEVVFFNYYHHGDIHESREYVKQIVLSGVAERYVYAKRMESNVLEDIDNLVNENFEYVSSKGIHHHSHSQVIDDVLYINLWIPHWGGSLCTLDSYHGFFNELFQKFTLGSLLGKEHYVPQIYFYKLKIDGVDKFLKRHSKPVLIVNGEVWSGQSQNFDFNGVIVNLANEYPRCTFLLTDDKYKISGIDNIFYTRDIIGKEGCDLNENAYISIFCDVIVGRSSGVYTFAIVKENVLNPNKSIICFSHNCKDEALFTDLWIAKTVHSANYNLHDIENVIKGEIIARYFN